MRKRTLVFHVRLGDRHGYYRKVTRMKIDSVRKEAERMHAAFATANLLTVEPTDMTHEQADEANRMLVKGGGAEQ